jgi:hypothetical protein
MASIKHKTSTVAGKKPLPADIERGELAINLADALLFTKDASDAIIQLCGGGVLVADAEPASPGRGDLWFDSINLRLMLRYDDGSTQQWVVVSGAAAPPPVVIQAGATAAATPNSGDLWIDTSTASSPALKRYDGTNWLLVGSPPVTVPDATAAVKGVVQLADAAAWTAGMAGRVLDVATMKTLVLSGGTW